MNVLRTSIAACGLVLMAMSACVPTLYPLYTEGDVISDHRLAGTWSPPGEEEERWFFSPSDDAYRLVIVDHGTCSPYEARLVRIGELHFLDLVPIKPKFDDGVYDGLLLRLHGFALVELEEDRLVVSAPDLDVLKRLMQEGAVAARLLELDGTAVLADPTPDLQELVVRLAAEPGAFGEPEVLVRR